MRHRKSASPAAPPAPASLWRRSLASIVDVTAVLTVLAGMVAVAAPLIMLFLELEEHSESLRKLSDRWSSKDKKPRKRRSERRRIHPEWLGAGLVTQVARRNHQTRSQALMRIRRVNARDGGPVTIKSAIVHYIVSQLITISASRAADRAIDERWERAERLMPEIVEIQRKHAGDTRAFLRAATKLCNEHDANPFTPIVVGPAIQLAIHIGCILALPKRQGVADFASGIATTKTGSPI